MMVELTDLQKRYIKEELKPYLEKDDISGILSMLSYPDEYKQDDEISMGYYASGDSGTILGFYAPIRAFLCDVGVPLVENLNNIPGNFCWYVKGLTSFHIPSNIKTIDRGAFKGCSDLSDVTFEEGLTRIEMRAFGDTNLSSIVLPKSLTYVGLGAFGGITHLEVRVQGDVKFSPDCFPSSTVDLYVPADIWDNDSSNISYFLANPHKGKLSLYLV